MAEPSLIFFYNTSSDDTPYNSGTYRIMAPGSDLIVFTGGGIGDNEEGMGSLTLASGVRSPTIRPALVNTVIPFTYVESGDTMYYVPLAGQNSNRYVFGVEVSGTINSDLYFEAWDDYAFSTTQLPVLSGTANNSYKSCVNAITTTSGSPAIDWTGADEGAAYLRGYTNRVGLKGVSPIIDEFLYFNVYIRLETDSPTFHSTPVFAFRYLYT